MAHQLAAWPCAPSSAHDDPALCVQHLVATNRSELAACEHWASSSGSWAALPANASQHGGLQTRTLVRWLMRGCPLRRVQLHAAKLGLRLQTALTSDVDAYMLQGDARLLCGILSGGHVPPASTLVSVGAAFGGEILVGRALGMNVSAFEARSDEFDRLRTRFAQPRVRLHHAAVTNVPGGVGAVTLHAAGDSSSLVASAVAGHLEAAKAAKEPKRSYEVAAVSLDRALAASLSPGERVGAIHVDTQGSEYEVLASGVRTIRAHRPLLFFEYEPSFRGEDAPRVLCLVRALGGYSCAKLRGDQVACAHAPAADT